MRFSLATILQVVILICLLELMMRISHYIMTGFIRRDSARGAQGSARALLHFFRARFNESSGLMGE